ncbi:MAG TPA: peptide chain release factor N(5)-glutamine methyltransferase [Rhizomicrobium sp.]|nr:peptide chain release factor N(5)-glutamine methyltransferase [Rhizomicrobium sp.]
MSTIREAWIRGAGRLAAAGIDSARLDARVLLAHTMNLSPGESVSAREPSPEELARYDELLERRAAREPVAYITGEREFWSLSFAVGPGVLIPRPETETLLEQAARHFLDHHRPLEVLDLGTGSGAILIAFLKDYPRAHGMAVERSAAALRWAYENARRHGVADRSIWGHGSWEMAEGRTYDLIFSNPPYLASSEAAGLAPEIAAHEPMEALLAGPEGLEAHRAIASVAAATLRPGGRVIVEVGTGQAEPVAGIFLAQGLEIVGVAPDLADIPRALVAGRT